MRGEGGSEHLSLRFYFWPHDCITDPKLKCHFLTFEARYVGMQYPTQKLASSLVPSSPCGLG